jgi:hypothetical protein
VEPERVAPCGGLFVDGNRAAVSIDRRVVGDLNGAPVAGGFRPPGAHGARFVGEGFLRPAHRSFNHADGRTDDIAANNADYISSRLSNSGPRVGGVGGRFTCWTGATGQKRSEDEKSAEKTTGAQMKVHNLGVWSVAA